LQAGPTSMKANDDRGAGRKDFDHGLNLEKNDGS
jgi:hypothetical protein